MLNSIRVAFVNGGWAMWLIFALGLAAVGVAVRFARTSERSLLGTIRWLLVAVMASGCFGFCVDMQAVTRYAVGIRESPPGQGSVAELRGHLVLEGLNESLNTLSSAFLLSLVTAVLVAVGHRRSRESAPSLSALGSSPTG
jgi:hypothetical protein